MTQLKRFYETRTPYFITFVTEGRKDLFNEVLACELLVKVLIDLKSSCNYQVYAFVVMPDHVHIVISADGDMNISEIVRRIKGRFARFFNVIYNTNGSFWQASFYDKGIRSRSQLDEIIKYIHHNPVRKEIAIDPWEYVYSSSSFYESGDKRFAKLIDPII